MSTVSATRGLTLADYVEMPETNQPQEIVNGELRVMPGSDTVHERIIRRIVRRLEGPVEESGFGEVFQAPLDVLIPDLHLKVAALYARGTGQAS